MKRRAAVLALAALLATSAACSKPGAKKATKEQVTAALQAEAATMKRDGEKLDPSLGVKATWTIAALEVKEQPDNASTPYVGSVRFKINSVATDPMGPAETNFERTFDYGYDAKLAKWLFKPRS
jgi:hypothetical protein